jgi:tRNA 2-thiouridine synthesizing protein B
MLLHTINKPPGCMTLYSRMASTATRGDSIIFIEDAVIAARSRGPYFDTLEALGKLYALYALQSDVSARGLDKLTSKLVKIVDYDQFVELTSLHKSVVSWY